MTRLISALMAVALLVSVAPVMAGDSFHALSRLPAGLTPLDNTQLATVEGGLDIEDNNIAVVIQKNEAWQWQYVGFIVVAGNDNEVEVEQDIEQKNYASVNQYQ